jgi:hypothetical protein
MGGLGGVGGGRIELGSEEAGLAAVLVAVHQARHGEPLLHDLEGVLLRCLQPMTALNTSSIKPLFGTSSI